MLNQSPLFRYPSLSLSVLFQFPSSSNMFNCKNLFQGFFFHEILILTVIILTLVEVVLSVDKRFEACKPRNCGHGPNISYPFWIQEDYCGYPGFRVTCKNNEPILDISGNDYIIRDISYKNQFLLVENSVVLNVDCPAPLRNSTFNGQSPFHFGPNVGNLFFFYNCTGVFPEYENLTYPVNSYCANSSSNGLVSFAMFVPPGYLSYKNYDPTMCQSSILEPVQVFNSGETIDQERDYRLFLEKGFTLEWADKKRCSHCQESGGYCGFESSNKDNLVCFCIDKSYPKRCNNGTGKPNIKKKVAIGVGAAVGGSLLTFLLVFLLFRRWRRKNNIDTSSNLLSRNISPDLSLKPDPEKGSAYFQTPIFTYKELEEATNNFDDSKELGDGGFGTVYRGELRDGRVVAVKRLYENNCKRVEQFMNEITILSLLRHPNLVSLYGCTSRHSRELLLVYEYVPNGTVADHLHGEHANAGLVTWPIRMTIAIESAGALAYLHASDIIHRDVKTNNILLDNNFHVKVADFGLSRLFPTDVTHVSTAPQGTPGYVDPEYYQCYQLTDKSDVYSFGVVLIELISSMPAVDINRHRHEINLSNMAINKIHNHALHELVDSSLGFESDYSVRRMITLVAELAFRCLQQETEMRPSMVEVLQVLKGIEDEGSKVVKAMEVDIPAEDVRLLKNISPPSPVSVTGKWVSISTTPNTSEGIEDEGSKVVKAMEVDIPAEDVRLLKNIPPLSPDSVTGKWVSVSTTPNTSG